MSLVYVCERWMGMTTKASRLQVQYFSLFLFFVSDALAFADQESNLNRQSCDEDGIEIEAGTRCAKYFKDGYRCVSSRTALHHTAAGEDSHYVAGTGDGEEDEADSAGQQHSAKNILVACATWVKQTGEEEGRA